MVKLTKAVKDLLNITEQDYILWCKKNKKACLKDESKKEFFELVRSGKLIRDESGKFISKM